MKKIGMISLFVILLSLPNTAWAEKEEAVNESEESQNEQVETPKEETPKEETTAPSGTYIVQQGDTLYRISKNVGLTVDELKAINQLADEKLSIGQRLNVVKGTEIIRETPTKSEEVGKETTEETQPKEEPEKAPEQTPKEETEVEYVEEKEEKALDELAKEGIDESLVVEVEEKTVEEVPVKKTENKTKDTTNGDNGFFVIGGVLLLAALLTTGVVYWKRKWFL